MSPAAMANDVYAKVHLGLPAAALLSLGVVGAASTLSVGEDVDF